MICLVQELDASPSSSSSAQAIAQDAVNDRLLAFRESCSLANEKSVNDKEEEKGTNFMGIK